MADVVVTIKVMPTSPSVSLTSIEGRCREAIEKFGGEVGKVEVQPVAFGLKALILIFVMDESLGSTEELEQQIQEVRGVQSVEVTDVRRAIG